MFAPDTLREMFQHLPFHTKKACRLINKAWCAQIDQFFLRRIVTLQFEWDLQQWKQKKLDRINKVTVKHIWPVPKLSDVLLFCSLCPKLETLCIDGKVSSDSHSFPTGLQELDIFSTPIESLDLSPLINLRHLRLGVLPKIPCRLDQLEKCTVQVQNDFPTIFPIHGKKFHTLILIGSFRSRRPFPYISETITRLEIRQLERNVCASFDAIIQSDFQVKELKLDGVMLGAFSSCSSITQVELCQAFEPPLPPNCSTLVISIFDATRIKRAGPQLKTLEMHCAIDEDSWKALPSELNVVYCADAWSIKVDLHLLPHTVRPSSKAKYS
eukprot:TRINITY_DN9878_c0_g1_i1.p1 TRINITY_DN9878_c0_g1~~TRINITY_DN9878_c0_g1_i1.p1  ORF type:complete len:326 (+),score=52.14 TRINITY_DN9878_c0_g1_i1:66-1043(+)